MCFHIAQEILRVQAQAADEMKRQQEELEIEIKKSQSKAAEVVETMRDKESALSDVESKAQELQASIDEMATSHTEAIASVESETQEMNDVITQFLATCHHVGLAGLGLGEAAGLSEDQISGARALFTALDTDGGGIISKSELANSVNHINDPKPEWESTASDIRTALGVDTLTPGENTTNFFKYLDVDGDGEVTTEEFIATLGFIIGKEKLDALSKSDLKQKKQQVVMTLQSQMKAIAEHSVQVQVLQEEHESTLGAAKQEHVQATKALEEQIANISEATATEHEQDLLQLTQEVTEEMNELNAANDAKVRLKPRDVCQ